MSDDSTEAGGTQNLERGGRRAPFRRDPVPPRGERLPRLAGLFRGSVGRAPGEPSGAVLPGGDSLSAPLARARIVGGGCGPYARDRPLTLLRVRFGTHPPHM